jgi:hypothetical protein
MRLYTPDSDLVCGFISTSPCPFASSSSSESTIRFFLLSLGLVCAFIGLSMSAISVQRCLSAIPGKRQGLDASTYHSLLLYVL